MDLDAYQVSEWMKWLLGVGAVATATGAIWRMWLGPAVRGIVTGIDYLRRAATALEYLSGQMPEVMQRLDEGTARFNEHGDRLNEFGERIEQIEGHVFPQRKRQPSNRGEE